MQILNSTEKPAPRTPRVLVEVVEPNPSGDAAFDKYDIHLGRLDSSSLELESIVVPGPTDDGQPRWRPQGGALFLHRTHIADDCSGPLFEMSRPEGKRRNIVSQDVSSFDVSHQGDRLAFVLPRPENGGRWGPSQLWISRADGGRARQVALPSGFEPREVAFTPDGGRLLFTTRLFNPEDHGDEQSGLYGYDLKSRRLTRYTGSDCFNPTVAPDGSMVAYTTDHELRCLDLRTQRDRRMANLDACGSWAFPSFSLDGRHLYYCEDGSLLVVPAAGGVPRCLASGIAGVAFEPGVVPVAKTGFNVVDSGQSGSSVEDTARSRASAE